MSPCLIFRATSRFILAALIGIAGPTLPALAEDAKAVFDVPDKIECKDVTPSKCAAAHPDLKVIEAKFRISASLEEGSEASVVDFTYMISSPKMRLKILDYLPNTTLESRYADDRIEVADRIEDTDTTNLEALAGYSIFSLSAARNQVNRRTESNQYERIAPKSLVLASGTMNRGHGVFYKLRQSNSASLEGAKEFTFLAIVPKAWRADWCTVVCTSRANKKTLLGNAIVSAGAARVDVGLHMCGDKEASDLCVRLCQVQQADDGRLVKQWGAEAAKATEASSPVTQAAHWTDRVDELVLQVAKKTHLARSQDERIEMTRRAVNQIEDQLGKLSGAKQLSSVE
jgi:hypothetical protein